MMDSDAARNAQHLMVPMSSRTLSNNSDGSQGSSSNPAQSLPSPTSPIANGPFPTTSSSAPMFRSRAKTLASLTTATRLGSHTDLMPREIQLPVDPLVNGHPIEAHLYKDAAECPICFLYYPPYLNRTRCCDQPICSECFVQIKRPDPHPPEHGDDPNHPNNHPDNNATTTTTTSTSTTEEEGQGPRVDSADTQLVSEPAACPFCVQPELGVTYAPPSFRRGLAYATEPTTRTAPHLASPMSSSTSSLSSGAPNSNSNPTSVPGRRRATSLSATDPNVVTTDRIRPDWAQKLTNARAHAARRSAAATALHTAAYLVNSNPGSGGGDSRNLIIGRRRRASAAPEAQSQSQATRGSPALNALAFLTDRRAQQSSHQPETQSQSQSQSQVQSQSHTPAQELDPPDEGPAPPPRGSSRRSRLDDLEEMMMMEAIRLSLASEEDRRKREEKDMKKEAKKREKEAKKVEKSVRKNPPSNGPEPSSSALNYPRGVPSSSSSVIEEEDEEPVTKGKAPAPVSESGPGAGPGPGPGPGPGAENEAVTNEPAKPSHLRHMSSASSSSISSLIEDENVAAAAAAANGLANANSNANANASSDSSASEPMFNFRSLAAMIGDEDEKGEQGEHTEHVETTTSTGQQQATAQPETTEPEVTGQPKEATGQPDETQSQRECLLPKELETRSVEITGTHPAT